MLSQDERVVFLGQAVRFPGTFMTDTLTGVPRARLIEMPVAEEMQMGISTGLALAGYIPVTLYPRWNFLLLAANQLINHLDKLPILYRQPVFVPHRPKVIVRVAVGPQEPIHPQEQHVGDFTAAFELLCKNMKIVRLENVADILPEYKAALERESSTILVEYGDRYGDS